MLVFQKHRQVNRQVSIVAQYILKKNAFPNLELSVHICSRIWTKSMKHII